MGILRDPRFWGGVVVGAVACHVMKARAVKAG